MQKKTTHSYIWNLIWPLIIAQLTVPLLGITDTFVIGQDGAKEPIAALAIGSKIFEFSYFLLYFLTISTTSLVAKALSKKDKITAQLWGLRSLFLSLFLGFAMVPLLIFVTPYWIVFLGGQNFVYQEALQYVQIGIIGVPAQIATQGLSGWLIGQSQTKKSMILSITMNIINIVLTVIFVLHLDLHIKGAIAGTVISQWLGLFLALILSRNLFSKFILRLPSLKDFAKLRQLMLANLDLFIRSACIMLFIQCLIKMSASMGTLGIASMGIIVTLLLGSTYIQESLQKTIQILSAKTYNSDDLRSFKTTITKLKFWVIGAIVMFSGLYFSAGKHIINLITKDIDIQDQSAALIPFLIIYIFIASWSYYYNAILMGLTAFKQLRNAYLVAFTTLMITIIFYFYPNPSFKSLWFTAYAFEITRLMMLYRYFCSNLKPSLHCKKSRAHFI